ACLGFCPPAGVIVPRVMDFALQVSPPPYDPDKARQLLAEAGYPRGFDAGEFVPIPGFPTVGEAALNNLNAVGFRTRMRPMERAAFSAACQEKNLRGLGGGVPRVVEHTINSIPVYPWPAYEDVRVKN